MNALQEKSAADPGSTTRPFTRACNVLYDEVKPRLPHKVDRCVLDALIRLLEGFHQSWIALPILELAEKAGVSPWSTSHALARLEQAGIITRRAKLLPRRGRYIWEIALTPRYRVLEKLGVAPAELPAPRPPAPTGTRTLPRWPPLASEPVSARAPAPPTPEPPSQPSLFSLRDLVPAPSSPPPKRSAVPPAVLDLCPPADPVATPDSAPAAARQKKKAPELTPAQKATVTSLRDVGIDYWMARKLARKHSPEMIQKALVNLRGRHGTVRNPAAWLVREIERGGYSAPPGIEQAQRQAERAAREAQQRDQEEQGQRQAEERIQAILAGYRELPQERRLELEQQARAQLARLSKRLADGPLDLGEPGPVRSQLLELLEPAG